MRGVLQREVLHDLDPVEEVQPESLDLLYGFAQARGATIERLGPQPRIQTIDDYNQAIGLNAKMEQQPRALQLLDVREQPASRGAWPWFDQSLYRGRNRAPIDRWIALLRANRTWIGLADLSAKGGLGRKAEIKRKGRFRKNLGERPMGRADRLTAGEARRLLSPKRSRDDAQRTYEACHRASAPPSTTGCARPSSAARASWA